MTVLNDCTSVECLNSIQTGCEIGDYHGYPEIQLALIEDAEQARANFQHEIYLRRLGRTLARSLARPDYYAPQESVYSE